MRTLALIFILLWGFVVFFPIALVNRSKANLLLTFRSANQAEWHGREVVVPSPTSAVVPVLEPEVGQLRAALCHSQPQQVTDSPSNGHIFKRNALLLEDSLREERWGAAVSRQTNPQYKFIQANL